MLKVSDLVLSRLKSNDYSDVTFKLVWVTGISIEPGNNNCRLLFKSVKARKDFFIVEGIPPELLNLYIVGTYYQKGKVINLSDNIQNIEIEITSQDNKIIKVKDIPPYLKSNNIPDFKEHSKSINDQYVWLGKSGDYSVIIPCFVIGSAFYFTSTTMRHRIFDSKIESLYYKTGLEKIKNLPYVFLKPGVPDSDAVFVYFYATDDYAKSRWHSIKNNLYAGKKIYENKPDFKGYVPIKIDFPFKEIGKLQVSAFIEKKIKRITVREILYRERKIFKWDEIVIKRNANGERKTNIIPISKPKFRFKTNNTGIISTEPPSNKNSTIKIVDDEYGDYVGVRKIKEIIRKNNNNANKESNGSAIFIAGQEEKDLSFNQARNLRNFTIRPAETKKKESDYFSFEDFKELMEMFIKKYSGYIKRENIEISEPAKIPVRKNKKHYNERESEDGKNIRNYLTVRFEFAGENRNENVLIIELSQKNSKKGFSIFIFTSGRALTADMEKEFLKKYSSNMKLDRIETLFLTENIRLIRKKHPDKKDKSKSFTAWGEDLVKKLKI